jgi:hypothetical protein
MSCQLTVGGGWDLTGDLGRRFSISGVVPTRCGEFSGTGMPRPPDQTFPSLSANVLMYAWKDAVMQD